MDEIERRTPKGTALEAIGLYIVLKQCPRIKKKEIMKQCAIGPKPMVKLYAKLEDAKVIKFNRGNDMGYMVLDHDLNSVIKKLTKISELIIEAPAPVYKNSQEEKIEKALEFYRQEARANKGKPYYNNYIAFVKYLNGDNPIKERMDTLLLIDSQVRYHLFIKLKEKSVEMERSLVDMLDDMYNDDTYTRTKKNLYSTLNKWMNISFKKNR